jgi:hypothetical protein
MPVVFLHPPSLNRHPWVHRVFVFRRVSINGARRLVEQATCRDRFFWIRTARSSCTRYARFLSESPYRLQRRVPDPAGPARNSSQAFEHATPISHLER